MNKLATYCGRFLVIIVAMQIINIGLYAQDFKPMTAATPGEETNIINSITEYIAESVLQKANSFPEKRNGPHNQSHKHHLSIKQHNIKLINRENHLQPIQSLSVAVAVSANAQTPYHNFVRDITPPPPKA
ncbi:hypothetical protein [Foetidibacter luteolus]|uniref:hypothetical protein n=1 Tax=Foetidibacter luteolus TaxID=2608880 RepID=UPI00129A2432|nr:hypothetical protein [Foetidibacter luteolus]